MSSSPDSASVLQTPEYRSEQMSPVQKSPESSADVETVRPRPVKSDINDAVDDMLNQIEKGLRLEDSIEPNKTSDVCYAYKSQTPLLWAEFGQPCKERWDDIEGVNVYLSPEDYPPKPDRQQLENISSLSPTDMTKPLTPIYFPAYVQQRTDPMYFHLLPMAVEPTFNSLEAEMNEVYNAGDEIPDLEYTTLSTAVAARSSTDGKWYRARVDGSVTIDPVTGEDHVVVFFVDWGNRDLVPLADVKPLLSRFGLVPPLAFHCRMMDSVYTGGSMMTAEQVAIFNQVMSEEANDMVHVTLFSLVGPPYVVSLGFHWESPTQRKGLTFDRCIVPLTEDQKQSEYLIQQGIDRVNYKQNVSITREGRMIDIRTPPNSSDEEEDDHDIFSGLADNSKWMTDEQWKEHVLEEWRESEEEWLANRKRQRTGPSLKVVRAEIQNAKLLAQGKGRHDPIDWKMENGRPGTQPTDFSRGKILFITEYRRPARPSAEKYIDVIVTYVEDTRNLWVQDERQMRLHKELIDSLQLKYSDDMSSLNPNAFAPGLACVVRDPDLGNRFARCEVIRFIPNSFVEVRNVDLGNRLPLIPWANIACIKPLRYLLAFRDAPNTFHIKIRQLSERAPHKFPQDADALRDVVKVGSCWVMFNDDVTKVPPFRVRLGYREYPIDYETCQVIDIKHLFDSHVERRTGIRPQYMEHEWAPPLRKRKEATRTRKLNKFWQECLEFADMTPVAPPVFDDVLMGSNAPVEVLVTAIAGPQRFFFQTSAMTATARQMAKEITHFYVLHTMTEQWDGCRIHHMDNNHMQVGKSCVVFFPGDNCYHRGTIFETRGGSGVIDGRILYPTSIRVRFTDFGDETDWMTHVKACFPLKAQFRDPYPQQCIEGCLDGFQNLTLTLDEQKFLSSLMDDWLNPGKSTWHAYFWKTDGRCVVRLLSEDGDVLNDLLKRELFAFQGNQTRHAR